YTTARQARANLAHMLAESATGLQPAMVTGRTASPPSSQVAYRSARAALIGEYASRIAQAIRYAPRHELDAILANLPAERAAAVAALAELQGNRRPGRMGANRRRQRAYRLKRLFKMRS